MPQRAGWLLSAVAVSLVLTVQPLRDSDVWWHLAMGHYIGAHGIPAVEPFSFLHAANPWVGQQWLYEVGLAHVIDLGGPPLASLLMGCVASAALLIAVLSVPAARRARGPWLAAAVVLSALAAAQLLGVRGQVITLLGVAIVLYLLARWRQGSTRVLLMVPPLFLLWANLHAGFIVGLAIAVLALLTVRDVSGRSRALLAATIGAGVVATLVNPAGAQLWTYVAGTFANPTVTGVVTEWQSPSFHDAWLRVFELEAVLLVVAWALAPRRDLFDVVLAGVAFTAALQAQRNASLFALIATPQLAAYGAAALSAHRGRLPHWPALARWRRPPSWFGAVVAGVVVVGATLAVAPRLTADASARFEATHEPKAAADFIAAHLGGHRLYSIDTWGGYLAHRFSQGRVVYLYDETAVFGDSALQRYLAIHDVRPDWASVLGADRIGDAVLPDAAPEVSALLTLGWTVDCHDVASSSVVMSAAPAGGALSPLSGPDRVRSTVACS